ncbi:hypothetical protein HOY82DRAFT_605993 [Tuber indicum]|nr:hypothetical protein HOY82DRAFT_605993 [Tuber indicum]
MSTEISHQILATMRLLEDISLDTQKSTVDHVKTIRRSLGHQLEEEIASKELWQEHSYTLQTSKKLYNNTDRRKLSVARDRGGDKLLNLPDACLDKDRKQASHTAKVTHKGRRSGGKLLLAQPKKVVQKAPRRISDHQSTVKRPATPMVLGPLVQQVMIASTAMVVLIDSEYDPASESESDELSDFQWSTNDPISYKQFPNSQSCLMPACRIRPSKPIFRMILNSCPLPPL